MYATGEGVPEDDTEAVRWYQLAAAQGDAPAQFNLGVMYDNGESVPQDNVSAHMWLNLGAGFHPISMVRRRRIFVCALTPTTEEQWRPAHDRGIAVCR